jgi:hypothetical protein
LDTQPVRSAEFGTAAESLLRTDIMVDISIVLMAQQDPGRMALAAAGGALTEARLIERICSEDAALLVSARIMAVESTHDYPSRARSWNETGVLP